MADLILPAGFRDPNTPGSRRPPPPDCEWTAPGAETEAIDCWAEATRRHVTDDGVTVGLFCAKHAEPKRGANVTVEDMN